MMSSNALSEESEKDVLPWLKLAEDLRRLKLDVEVYKTNILNIMQKLKTFLFKITAQNAADMCYG